jgi:hypothetical protein
MRQELCSKDRCLWSERRQDWLCRMNGDSKSSVTGVPDQLCDRHWMFIDTGLCPISSPAHLPGHPTPWGRGELCQLQSVLETPPMTTNAEEPRPPDLLPL